MEVAHSTQSSVFTWENLPCADDLKNILDCVSKKNLKLFPQLNQGEI